MNGCPSLSIFSAQMFHAVIYIPWLRLSMSPFPSSITRMPLQPD